MRCQVKYVVNYDMPKMAEDYIHRVGHHTLLLIYDMHLNPLPAEVCDAYCL